MTYANYGGFSYMGIERPALVRAFKDLRGQGFAARLGLSNDESYSMRYNVSPGQYGAVWTEASRENLTWRQGTGAWQAQFGSYVPLEISVSTGGALREEWTAFRNAGYVCKVLETHGLHPFIDLDAYVTRPEQLQQVCIRLYPSTRLYEMTEADKNHQANLREIRRNYQARQDAAVLRHHESRIESYIERYATALCDQSVLRSNQSTEILQVMEQRAETIQQFMTALQGERTYWHRFTDAEEERVLREGAEMAKERLETMLRDVNVRLEEMFFATMPNAS